MMPRAEKVKMQVQKLNGLPGSRLETWRRVTGAGEERRQETRPYEGWVTKQAAGTGKVKARGQRTLGSGGRAKD
jgi:hypothetical protein